jgi:hypothetical protein
MLLISDDVENLLDQMENYISPTVDKWIIRENNLA